MIDLFVTALNYRLSVYFSPLNDPMAAGTDVFLQEWDRLQAYAFPPFALIFQVINKLRSCKGTLMTLIALFWPQKEWFASESLGGSSDAPSSKSRSSQTAPFPSPAPEPPRATASCVVTVQ